MSNKQEAMVTSQDLGTTDAEVAILSGRRPGPRPVQQVPGAAPHFHDYAALRKSQLAPRAVVIRSDDVQYSARMLRELRRDPARATALAFIDGPMPDSEEAALADGALPDSPDALAERIRDLRGRLSAMAPKEDPGDADALLLEYLWLRPGFVLEPYPDWRHPQRYRYPILEALDRGGSDPETWLRRLDQQGLIERVALKDRQRECDFCGSAHLSFTDVCPNCRSIEIGQRSALHCFTCGFIAPEERFFRGEQRACPKCGARLQQLGTDYDRPTQTNACERCEHVFVDGEVIARCVICGHSMQPSELRLHLIHSWRLSGPGRLAAQGRRAVQATAFSEARNYASQSQFATQLDWVLKIARQQRDLRFALFGLRLENHVSLAQSLGTARTAQLLESFIERLREPLGEADALARPDPATLWLLLSNGDRKRLRKLHGLVQQLTDEASQEDSAGPCWRAVDISVSGREAADCSTESLLEKLKAALDMREATEPQPTHQESGAPAPSAPRPEVEAASRNPKRVAPRIA